jgi:hypothetical protein
MPIHHPEWIHRKGMALQPSLWLAQIMPVDIRLTETHINGCFDLRCRAGDADA